MADHDLLIQIKEKVDSLVSTCSGLSNQLTKKAEALEVGDHETRIRNLEKFRWQLAGVGALSGVLSGLVIGVVFHYWK